MKIQCGMYVQGTRNEQAQLYIRRSLTQKKPFTINTFHSYVDNQESQSQEDREYLITCRKRVVQFVQKWVIAVRNAVFEDPVAVDFIEVNNCVTFWG